MKEIIENDELRGEFKDQRDLDEGGQENFALEEDL